MTTPAIAVIGTGRMGPSIAVAFAAGGCPVLLVGRGAAQLERARAAFDEALAALRWLGAGGPGLERGST